MNLSLTETTAEESAPMTRAGKELAYKDMVRTTMKKAYWMALDLLDNPSDAEDARQEAYLKAYERWDDFRGDAQRSTWFYRILVNHCLTRRKRRGLWKSITRLLQKAPENSEAMKPAIQSNPEQETELKGSLEAIRKALVHLTEQQRTVFVLRYFHDMSLEEVAQATGSATGTIKSHLFRALNTLRQHLAPAVLEGSEASA